MSLPELSLFRLVGGTSLSLQLGHRISVDLDFFTERSFDINNIISIVSKEEAFELQSISSIGFTCIIKKIKCDFYNWGVPFIRELNIIDDIRLASIEDIAAYKLDAIIKRKEKKDFWDIEKLMDVFTFGDMFTFYKQKFIYNDIKIVLDALSGIDSADESEEPIKIGEKTWEEVKNNLKSSWTNFKINKIKEKEQDKLDRILKAENLLKK